MKALDLFCGAGGAAMGLYRAGYTHITGVDVVAQRRYPFDFVQADALTFPLDGYDLIWASPPCQAYSSASVVHRNRGAVYPDLIGPLRDRLSAGPTPWIIENVITAPLRGAVMLCGLMFGLKVFRHRIFESSHVLLGPPHPSHAGKLIGRGYYCVRGSSGRWSNWLGVLRDVNKGSAEEWSRAMGIDWMTRKELTQAVPPAYSEYLGRQMLDLARPLTQPVPKMLDPELGGPLRPAYSPSISPTH